MAQHRRGNRALKKPKQAKGKLVVPPSASPVTAANPVKTALSTKRK
jgi:hypothetical protein